MLSPGDRLGPYEVVSPLGAGGMGEGYRARDTRLGREVALKVLPEALATDPAPGRVGDPIAGGRRAPPYWKSQVLRRQVLEDEQDCGSHGEGADEAA
jgi:serine/threonine protein kinase